MIAYLSGKLLEKQANVAIVDVGGVGYEVSIPLSTFYELGDVGSDVSLRIYTHVREDAIQLFGFKTLRERNLYLRLISVQGIGPKMGIAMLSGMNAEKPTVSSVLSAAPPTCFTRFVRLGMPSSSVNFIASPVAQWR